MNGFPSDYPGHIDGQDTALNAEIELAMREHWGDPEMRGALIDDGYVVPTELPDLTLPDAVDLMLRAYWKSNSRMHKSLVSGDFLAAAVLMRNYDSAPDDIRIAPHAIVAGCIKAIVERRIDAPGLPAAPL
jgi:hypothetical protein